MREGTSKRETPRAQANASAAATAQTNDACNVGEQNSAQAQRSERDHAGKQSGQAVKQPGQGEQRERRDQLFSPMFLMLILFTLCCFITGQGLNSGTSVYLANYGDSATYAGLLAALFSVAAGVVRLLSGPIIDKRGRRVVMLVGTVVLIVGTFLPSLLHNHVLLIVARFLQGAGFSAASTAAATAAADVLPKSRMGEGIGFYGLGQAIAMSIGPALALALVNSEPTENLFYGLSLSALLSLFLGLACCYEKRPQLLPEMAVYRLRAENGELSPRAPRKSSRAEAGSGGGKPNSASPACDDAANDSLAARLFEKRALPGAIPQVVLCPAFAFGIFFMGLYGTRLGCSNPGLFYTVSALTMIVVRIKSAALMDKMPPLRLLGFAVTGGICAYALLLCCGLLLQGTPALDIAFYLSGVPYGFCLGISMPLNQSIAVKNTPPQRWGAANALFQLSIDCGMGVGCLVWGILNDALGFSFTICCVMVVILLSLLAAKACYPKEASQLSA